MQNKDDFFKIWLVSEKKYKKKTANDILCRIRRIRKIINISEIVKPIDLFQLEQTDEFNKLSTSVKSQLRKSLKLLMEFQKNVEKTR